MYRKMPAAKARIQLLALALLVPTATPTKKPMTAASAEIKLKPRAAYQLMPVERRMKKSPSSWGISWKTRAMVVLIPRERLRDMAAPKARPSVKLCNPSPTKISHARGLMVVKGLQNFFP
jgi:hypothetical protein